MSDRTVDVVGRIDAAVEGRCAGPGCTAPITAGSPSAWWCSQACQEAWQRQHATRPEEVRGTLTVGGDQARWRPGLADAAEGVDPEPVDLTDVVGVTVQEAEEGFAAVAARLAAAYEGLPEQTRAAPESGSLFWLPGPPADPENPTMADLDRGVDLAPYVVSFELGSVEAEREGRRS